MPSSSSRIQGEPCHLEDPNRPQPRMILETLRPLLPSLLGAHRDACQQGWLHRGGEWWAHTARIPLPRCFFNMGF